MAKDNDTTYILDSKSALSNKLLQADGTVTDLAGRQVVNPVDAYESKPALPNKFLNPDGTYSTLNEIIASMVDTSIFVIVEELPASGDEQKIYLVPDDKGGFVEYHWTGTKWDAIGTVEIDLSNYSTTQEMMNAIEAAALQTLNAAKAYTDEQIAGVSADPQVFYWDGNTFASSSIEFWNNIMLLNETTDILVVTGDSYVGGLNQCELIKVPKGCIKANKSTGWYNYVIYNESDPFESSHSTYTIYRSQVTFTIVDNVITNVSRPTASSATIKLLVTDKNYTVPYTPQYPGSPATKKYVDDSIATSVTNVLGGEY